MSLTENQLAELKSARSLLENVRDDLYDDGEDGLANTLDSAIEDIDDVIANGK